MKIAVTGASGHVGANLCRELLQRGYSVKALIHHDDRAVRNLDVELIRGSVNDPPSLDALCSDADVLFHLAAMISVNGKEEQLIKVNIEGTRNLIKACRESGIKRYIHFSSIHALSHDPLDQSMDETRLLVETSPMMYEVTKSRSEKLVLEEVAKGFNAIILNPTAIVGPNDYKPSLVGQVLIKLYKGTLPALVPGGYNWVDVRDVVFAAANAIENGRSGERYILSGQWLSVRDLARLLEKVTGKKTVRFTIPTSVAKIGVPFIRAYAAIRKEHPLYTNNSLEILKQGNRYIINDKARKELGFQSRNLENTLYDAITWFREHHYI